MKRLTTSAALVALLALLVMIAGRGPSAIPVSGGSTIPGEILVRYQGAPEARAALFATFAADAHYNAYTGIWRVRFADTVNVEQALATMRASPEVTLAQPNYRYVEAGGGDDPLYVHSQHPYYAAVNAPAAWAVETGSPDVTVAVLDDGVDIGHPELNSRIWTNPAEIPDNSIDDDANGCLDDVHGCNFLTDIPEADVDEGEHGTFVSGIIAGESENGEGVRSMAPGVTVMPVVVLDEPGIGGTPAVGTTEGLVAGILYAARSGAEILNMSLALDPTAGGICPTDPLVEDALREAHDVHGATIVASAGNFNIPCVTFPAASSYAIAVGAAGPPAQPDTRAFFSNWGDEVAVAAPGMDLVSTCPDPVVQGQDDLCLEPSYGRGSGTSFSAPIVSGLAALILSHDPSLTNEQVRERLQSTARDLPDDLNPHWDGSGMVDAGAALAAGSAHAVVDLAAPSVRDLTLTVEAGACAVTVWDKPDAGSRQLAGSFGVGECAGSWPPSTAVDWRLHVQNAGRKAARLNAWAIQSGDVACPSTEIPVSIPPGATSTATLACDADTIVANDTPERAMSISATRLPRTLEQDVRHATSTGDPIPSCAELFSRTIWYRIPPASEPRDLVVDTFGSAFDTVLALYRGDPGALEEVACNDEFVEHQSRITWRAEPGRDYYVMAAAYQAIPAGLLRISFNHAYIPANDDRASAATLSSGGPAVVQPAHSATLLPSDPAVSCVGSYGYSLWFTLTSPTDAALAVDTTESDYNTVAAVFTADAGGVLSEVACNNDEASGIWTSRVTWQAAAGQTYWILVGAATNRPSGALRIEATPQ
jgi:subtilisin family serine protease